MPTAAYDTFTGVKCEPFYKPETVLIQNVKLPNSATYAAGTCLGELTATPGSFKAYATGNADGSETMKAILVYPVTVDASGNHTWAGMGLGDTRGYAPAYFAGYFKTTDLTGLDAAGVVDAVSRIVSGTVADGVLALGL